MIMSNFINESERHAELYNDFTLRQQRAIDIVTLATLTSRDDVYIREFLHTNQIADSEIHWLERTGHYLPVYA